MNMRNYLRNHRRAGILTRIMGAVQDELAQFGLTLPDVLLPAESRDLERWAVIACDQFTSEPEYWNRVRELTAGQPSTLDLILPEVYLSSTDVSARIQSVHESMRRYLAQGIFRTHRETAIALVRDTPVVRGRKGLLLAVDLELYDYSAGSRSVIRPTEQTIVERLPPRIRVRSGAPLELPHILVLIDDPEMKVIEPVIDTATRGTPLYRTKLMLGGGHIDGYPVPRKAIEEQLLPALREFASPQNLATRYGVTDAPLLAVGDGNHSLASAKAVWEKLKSSGKVSSDHPARWALVELINLHSPALPVEPIHRVIRRTEPSAFTRFVADRHSVQTHRVTGVDEAEQHILAFTDSSIRFGVGDSNGWSVLELSSAPGTLTVTLVQKLLDDYVAQNPSAEVDYIHGSEPLSRFAREPDTLSVLLPPIDRSLLIPTVLERGVLPRKAFSLGEAEEKRYYMEARIIDPEYVTAG